MPFVAVPVQETSPSPESLHYADVILNIEEKADQPFRRSRLETNCPTALKTKTCIYGFLKMHRNTDKWYC
ncbi:hypothetical protein F7725_005594 [Dissostichus mawsoni]|uniref:Uncharacterized protein n=1 Tax=Dissostichus mawsoni TaxID=36200 RepID=A0A7J5YU57_DISMA|nr:hypothetical protein F7725_005594 [Dissostichus mawsoni]